MIIINMMEIGTSPPVALHSIGIDNGWMGDCNHIDHSVFHTKEIHHLWYLFRLSELKRKFKSILYQPLFNIKKKKNPLLVHNGEIQL